MIKWHISPSICGPAVEHLFPPFLERIPKKSTQWLAFFKTLRCFRTRGGCCRMFQKGHVVRRNRSWSSTLTRRVFFFGGERKLKGPGDTLQGINISHPCEKENHLQNAIFGGYVSSLEGIWCGNFLAVFGRVFGHGKWIKETEPRSLFGGCWSLQKTAMVQEYLEIY